MFPPGIPLLDPETLIAVRGKDSKPPGARIGSDQWIREGAHPILPRCAGAETCIIRETSRPGTVYFAETCFECLKETAAG